MKLCRGLLARLLLDQTGTRTTCQRWTDVHELARATRRCAGLRCAIGKEPMKTLSILMSVMGCWLEACMQGALMPLVGRCRFFGRIGHVASTGSPFGDVPSIPAAGYPRIDSIPCRLRPSLNAGCAVFHACSTSHGGDRDDAEIVNGFLVDATLPSGAGFDACCRRHAAPRGRSRMVLPRTRWRGSAPAVRSCR